jgi:hypothetical protein
MNKLITLLALSCAVSAGEFTCSTNSLGEVTLEQYTPSEGETVLVIPQHVTRCGTMGASESFVGANGLSAKQNASYRHWGVLWVQ